ncbi:MAG: restriction endonuclease subunit S [Sulfuritalea sp.]|nr:restriction endonuclease subunit S [Sulfuritalea sp.]
MTAALRVEERATPYLVAPLLTDHLDTFASSPEGFKRLRELVFELAAQGGLIESTVPIAPVRLGDYVELVMGQAPPGNACNKAGVGTVFVKTGEFGPLYPEVREWTTKPLKFAKRGDVLICVVGATVGKLNLAIDCAIGRSVAAIRPCPELNTTYLYYTLMPFTLKLREKSRGSAQGVIGKEELSAVSLRIPDLAEQSRIVAKVEELMALIDALEAKVGAGETARGKLLDARLAALADSPDADATADAWAQLAPHFDLLLQTPADVDRLQQTLLQLAVKGRLVPQNPKDEPAAELLKRIRAEKDRLIAEGKIKRDKPLPSIVEVELPFAVPLGWQWAILGDVVLSSEAGWSPSCENMPRENGKWGVLKVSAVSWGEFLDEENKALPSHLEVRPEHEVMPGDFLLSRANTAELVARSVVAWNPKSRLMLSDKIIRLHIATGADKTYLNLFNNSSYARTHYVANASGTSASMKNVSREVVLSLPVPVPPATEQSRIVAAVASLTALCDSLRERLAARRELSAKLAAALTEAALQ